MRSCTTNPKIFFLTYGATRLADYIESASLKLESSDKNSTKIKHTPWNYPGGGKTLCGNKTVEINSIP
jgi:hypothetical protein